MANKSGTTPSQLRYKSENRRLKNKIRKLEFYTKDHPNDVASATRLAELKSQLK